jgi:succinate dehydrogenase / fumarate reductase, cytochrome b subunit
MSWLANLYRSAVAKKAVMAVTGIILFGFVLGHMAGNLKVYAGPEAFNEYAEALRTVFTPIVPRGAALWVARIGLLVAVIFHIHSAYAVTMMSRDARPVAYRGREYVKASYASRTMRWGGVIVLLFIIYHLLHLTTGQAHHDFVPGDVYHNFVSGFRIWWVSAFYILANLALGLHLYHGLWSMFSSLGVTHKRFEQWRRTFATAFAVIITAGNLSFPLSVLLGLVR